VVLLVRRLDLRRLHRGDLRDGPGWTDFWLAWIGVDVVAVPLLFSSHFYASGVLYIVYNALILYGFTVWLRASLVESPTGQRSSTVDA